jgi:acyl-CoA thioesterase
MVRDKRRAYFEAAGEKGLARKLGLTLVDVQPGYALVEMVPTEEDTNMFGTIHGGTIFSLMDEAFQISCNSHGNMAVALTVSIVYHNPAKTGVALRAESVERHCTQKTATYDITVTDANSILIASCQAVAYRKREMHPFCADEG